jgi:hypothetical protein
MDEDLRDALFENPEAGEFEELQDDFINEVGCSKLHL